LNQSEVIGKPTCRSKKLNCQFNSTMIEGFQTATIHNQSVWIATTNGNLLYAHLSLSLLNFDSNSINTTSISTLKSTLSSTTMSSSKEYQQEKSKEQQENKAKFGKRFTQSATVTRSRLSIGTRGKNEDQLFFEIATKSINESNPSTSILSMNDQQTKSHHNSTIISIQSVGNRVWSISQDGSLCIWK
jgi:hypothetical protein